MGTFRFGGCRYTTVGDAHQPASPRILLSLKFDVSNILPCLFFFFFKTQVLASELGSSYLLTEPSQSLIQFQSISPLCHPSLLLPSLCLYTCLAPFTGLFVPFIRVPVSGLALLYGSLSFLQRHPIVLHSVVFS